MGAIERWGCWVGVAYWALAAATGYGQQQELVPLSYENPGLVVDLGVGLYAFPLPYDWDGDGDLDLVLSCPDKPFNGTYVCDNPGDGTMVMGAPRRISRGVTNVQISWSHGEPRILTPNASYPDFGRTGLDQPQSLNVAATIHVPVGPYSDKIRANQWKYADLDGDGHDDLIVGIGDWSDYGWDNAYDELGNWTHGPLHGFVYWLRNEGSNEHPQYAEAVRLQAGGQDVDVYGWPSPNLADFDGDGDLDLLCGEFLDAFTYFENRGSRTRPDFASGKRLTHAGQTIRMDLQMILPVAVDWDGDGDQDLIVGDEDGRVAWIEHLGMVHDGLPQFALPRYFQQRADRLKCGALATPFAVDWDQDGDQDLLVGNTAGYVEYFEQLGLVETAARGQKATRPQWAAPRRLEADGLTLRIQAGPNGSIQGPCEAKWGYTTLAAADWDHDGRTDLMLNSIWGKILWYRNEGTATSPRLSAAQDVEVAWPTAPPKPAWTWWQPTARQLVTQWRTTPVIFDWNQDGLLDLLILDHEGYLAWFERFREGERLMLRPGQRVLLQENQQPLRLNERTAGGSGRRKLALVDWDGDGQVDLLANGINADWWRCVQRQGVRAVFQNQGPLAPTQLSSHTTSPTTVDWNSNGIPELVLGAEDGHLYYLER